MKDKRMKARLPDQPRSRLVRASRRQLALVALCSAILSLAVLEAMIRGLHRLTGFMDRYDLRPTVSLYSAHPFLNHTLAPNIDLIRPAQARINIPSYRMRTNSLGFRFDEHKFKTRKGQAFRIAIMGDSHVEGYAEEFTLPALLEQFLNRSANRRAVETMNWGVASYSPLVHYVNLKRHVLRYKPDLIVLQFDMTDVYDDNVRYRHLAEWDEEGRPVSLAPNMFTTLNIEGRIVSVFDRAAQLARRRPFYSWNRWRMALLEHSLLFRWLCSTWLTPDRFLSIYYDELKTLYPTISAPRPPGDFFEWCKPLRSPEIEQQVAFTFQILEHTAALLRRERIPLILTAVPHKAQLADVAGLPRWPPEPIQRLLAFCRARDIPCVLPTRSLEEGLLAGEAVYYSDNMHLDHAGQRRWAMILSDFLKKQRAIQH